ncbi:nucleotide exchange factor GrpE [Melghirimyces algeriensis]|uniref:Protein GrpE n=1 Tax=Melghirimyces algeriensis TaxID=910412 RepID=A0A521BVQ8_9BACL|nr:nucleotide exchange factor GrpE [Melghirimyces algeriensis]SMO50500.1 molecular chaperone GrpE [Melghirimyces algeriensis]
MSKDFTQDEEKHRPITARELRKAKEARERRKKNTEQTREVEAEKREEETLSESEIQTSDTQQHEIPTEPKEKALSDEQERAVQQELETAKEEAAKWKREYEENAELTLRIKADLENFRRRARKDREEAVKYAAVPLVESILPVLDNLERALETEISSEDAKSFHQGVEMVYRQLLHSLEEQGLSIIEAEGLEFNPHEHSAVMEVDSEGVEPGMVVEVLQKGYRFKDRVIRPSMVKVSS